MSDGEKTTLEFIKINNKHKYCGKDDVDFLLNLIEKQSKEIEELEKNRKVSQNFAKIEEVDYKMIAHQDVREALKQVLNSLLEKG